MKELHQLRQTDRGPGALPLCRHRQRPPPPLSPGGSSPRSRDRGAPLGTASGVRCPLVAPRCFPGTGASPPGAEYSTIPAYRGWVDGFNPGLRACCWLRQSACLPLLLGDQPPGTKGLLRGPSLRQGASHGVVSTGLGSAGLPTQPTHPPALLPPPTPAPAARPGCECPRAASGTRSGSGGSAAVGGTKPLRRKNRIILLVPSAAGLRRSRVRGGDPAACGTQGCWHQCYIPCLQVSEEFLMCWARIFFPALFCGGRRAAGKKCLSKSFSWPLKGSGAGGGGVHDTPGFAQTKKGLLAFLFCPVTALFNFTPRQERGRRKNPVKIQPNLDIAKALYIYIYIRNLIPQL